MKFRERLMLFCASLLCVACLVVFLRYGTYRTLICWLGWDNAWTRTVFADNVELQHIEPPHIGTAQPDEVPIDWATRYPFATPTPPPPPESPLRARERRFHEKTRNFEGWTDQKFLSRMHFIEALQTYDAVIGWNIVPDPELGSAVTFPDIGSWHFPKKADIAYPVSATADFASFCREQGINFLFVLVPSKISPTSIYATGPCPLDFSNVDGDAYLAGLQAHGVSALDLRPAFDTLGTPYPELFYRNDHHWKPEVAIWSAGLISRQLNEQFGYSIAPGLFELSRYEKRVYPRRFLGSYGKLLTLARTSPEDITFYLPTFPTSFHLEIPSLGIDRDGDASILYDWRRLDLSKGFYASDAYPYSANLYGDRAAIFLRNYKKRDGKKLLFIRESYCSSVLPFLASGVEQIDSIDPRYFTGSLHSFIEQERPDTVVVCYSAIQLYWGQRIPKNMFDFR